MILHSLLTILSVSSYPVHATNLHPAPSKEMARQRAPQIFNAVHNAMRQWGSSVHHNGMSMFLATVPQGVLLHHGNHNTSTPSEPDWLAYEIEHAEGFASGPGPKPKHPPGNKRPSPPSQKPLGKPEHEAQDAIASDGDPGWLHVYRTNRPLRYIYVDGMSAGKTTMGTLDTQDYLLRGDRSLAAVPATTRGDGPLNERLRAQELCRLCQEWHLDGIIRMEAGFEIIQCNFTNGLDQIQAHRRPRPQPHRDPHIRNLEYFRGITERYHDIGSHRTSIDYASMVSAFFFFPLNLTNPNPKRQDLPRLSSTTAAQLRAIKEYTRLLFSQRRNEPRSRIHWQDVSDMIISRYADRIEYMVTSTMSIHALASEMDFLLDLHMDYYADDKTPSIPDAMRHCTDFYLTALQPESEIDGLIHAAFEEVMSTICTSLFRVRALVSGERADASVLISAMTELMSLRDTLDWARFRQCRGCSVDEVCVIPMWPFGSEEEYLRPRCRNETLWGDGKSYWGEY